MKGPRESGATLVVPVPRGAEPSFYSKLASDVRSGNSEPAGGAVAQLSERGLPSLRVAARARLRDDGLLHVAYSPWARSTTRTAASWR